MVGSLVVGGFMVYKMKINSLLSQMSTIEMQHGQKFNEIQERLGKFEEMQKMYEVYWDRMLYTSQSKIDRSKNEYEYLIFEGKFLNQSSIVYAIRTENADVVSIEHQLNILLNCSHQSLCKLYYYTKSSEFLLIFTEKFTPISSLLISK